MGIAQAPAGGQTFQYGPAESQAGELYLPGTPHPAVVCLLHGGYWRMPHGRDQLVPIAMDLVARGYAVWNLGYRRVGEAGGGWPGTLQDVAAGIDLLHDLQEAGIDLDLARLVLAGHSAGGQLAFWSASTVRPSSAISPPHLRPMAVVGLAPAADLVALCDGDAGRQAISQLLGGTLAAEPARYQAASPLALLPLGVRQLIIHGGQDDSVLLALSRGYVATALAAGDEARLAVLPDAGHMDFLDPAGVPHALLCQYLEEIAGGDRFTIGSEPGT